MREEPNFRQKDIQWGIREGRTEGISEGDAKRMAKETRVLQSMMQKGEITPEQMESFFERMAELDEKK